MTQHDWHDGAVLGVFLNGDAIPDRTPAGDRVRDDSFLVLLNAGAEPVAFRLPAARFGRRWALELSTADPDAEPRTWRYREAVDLEPRTLVVLRRA
jgi:glycogen operon protein